MPLMINGGRAPDHWTQQRNSRRCATAGKNTFGTDGLRIALINNMPDAALEDTESQFFSLLDAASGDVPVHVQMYSLPEVPRGDRVQDHLSNFYLSAVDLLTKQFDGAIITGTEPRQPNLRDEPYWQTLVNVFDWAEEHTSSTVLSCLAAHASVLHSDGIDRHPLGDKQFGVFDYHRTGSHALTEGLPQIVRFPHSRWNEVRADALTHHGYSVLDTSAGAGVNLFVKKRGHSLFAHFQGHPEYGSRTLLKEYRRDVRRFLKQERPTYPSLPHGYFDPAGTALLSNFRRAAEKNPNEDTLAAFPESQVVDTLENTWHAPATHIYRNWLQYLLSNKLQVPPLASLSPAIRA
jgi:homoserine O-succinyltransferase/O-acetyltransferase